MSWIGAIDRPAAMKIQSSSSLSETQVLLFLRSKRRRKYVIAASLKSHVWLGPLKAVKMLAFGAGYQRMSGAPSSAVLHVTVHACRSSRTPFNSRQLTYRGKRSEATVPESVETNFKTPFSSFSISVRTICRPKLDEVAKSNPAGNPTPSSMIVIRPSLL